MTEAELREEIAMLAAIEDSAPDFPWQVANRMRARHEAMLARMSEPTVEVRIAVSVRSRDAWAAVGAASIESVTDIEEYRPAREFIEHGPGDRLSWVVARVPLPVETVETIEGEVV